MSTRSRIGKYNADGTVTSIYCHSDGYPEGVGQMLYDNYDEKKLDELLALGDLSFLGSQPVSKPEFWSSADKETRDEMLSGEYCRAYKDRGETNIDALTDSSVRVYKCHIGYNGIEYLYLFKDGQWLVDDEDGFRPVAELLDW